MPEIFLTYDLYSDHDDVKKTLKKEYGWNDITFSPSFIEYPSTFLTKSKEGFKPQDAINKLNLVAGKAKVKKAIAGYCTNLIGIGQN